MTVYVDDMLMPATVVGSRPAIWSHLVADSQEELIDFAVNVLGLNSRWIQYPGTVKEHFDVTKSVRAKALKAGAEPMVYGHEMYLHMNWKIAIRDGESPVNIRKARKKFEREHKSNMAAATIT